MKKHKLLAGILTLAVTLNLFFVNPQSLVFADGEDTLNVSKTVTWDYKNPGTATIEIISDVPRLDNTNVMFLGSKCSAHGMKQGTLEASINAIAENANVSYWIFNEDGRGANYFYDRMASISSSGSLKRGETLGSTKFNLVNGGVHSVINGFAETIVDELSNKHHEYDYIVMEFDASRLCCDDRMTEEEMTNVANALAPYYEQNKVIWITDGAGYENRLMNKDDRYGLTPYVPTNFYYRSGDNMGYVLLAGGYKALCSVMAPSYYLDNKDKGSEVWGYDKNPKADIRIAETDDICLWSDINSIPSDDEMKQYIRTLPDSYCLKLGERTKYDPINGDAAHEYLVYSGDSRQLFYNNAGELADFLYMAIQGTTMVFDDQINVTDDDSIKITDVTVYVSKSANLTSPEWLQKATLTVNGATVLTDANGIKYVTETNTTDVVGDIKVTTGNSNSADNNNVILNVQDLKNQINFCKIIINVTDEDHGFESCLYIKKDANGNRVDADGNILDPGDPPFYEMNPNNGPVDVKAYKNGRIASGTADATGKGKANAPAIPGYHVIGTVEGGSVSYTPSQGGVIESDDPLTISTPLNTDPKLEFTPDAGYGLDEVQIDGVPIDLSATGTYYTVTQDPTTGKVTVTFPDIDDDRTVFVKFILLEPDLSIVKSIVSPTSGTAVAGSTIKYKITVTNSGTLEAKNFTITDAIDTTKVSYKSSTPTGSYDSNTGVVTWSISSLAINCTVDLYLEVTVLDTIEGTTSVFNAAGGLDPNSTPIPTAPPVEQPLTGRDITVTYNYVGSYAPVSKPSDVTHIYGETLTTGEITAQTMPTIEGFTFDGWYLDSGLTTAFDSSLKLNGTNFSALQTADTLPLYGKWIPTLDFTLDKKVYFEGEEVGDKVLAPGDTVTYTIIVTNNNKNAAITDVEICDTLPEGLTIVATSISNSGTYSATDGKINWTVTIPANDSIELTFNATVPSDLSTEKDYLNLAAVVGADGREVKDVDDDVTFKAKPKQITLSVVKDWSDGWDNHQDDTVYVQLYRRTSSTESWEKVENAEFAISYSTTNHSASVTTDPYSAAGVQYEFTFFELTASGGSIIDGGSLWDDTYEPSYSVNSVNARQTDIMNSYVITKDDIEFTKTANELAAPGEQIDYTLTVKNTREFETATDIIVTDSLPDGVTLVTPDGLICSSTNDTAETTNNKDITWTVKELKPGASATLTIKVVVSSTLTNEEILNTANITNIGKTTYTGADMPLAKAPTDVRTFEVSKIWDDNGLSHSSDSVTVQLYQNDVAYGDPVTLNASNSWTYMWTKLPMFDNLTNRYVYTVDEVDVPGYTKKIDYYGDVNGSGNTSAKITNTLKEVVISYEFVGTDTPSGISVPTSDTVDWGTTYDSATKPSHNDYVFEGWFTDEACTTPYVDGTVMNDTTAPNGSKVLYGKWTKKVEVSYEFVGDTPASATIPDSELLVPETPYTADSKTGSITDYTFEGWFTDKACTTKYVDGTKISKDTVLYGKWTHNPEVSYQFVGDVPDAEKLPDSERVVPGTAYDADKNTTSHDDYIFDGWYTDPSCTTKYTDGTKINNDTTLYGKWTKKLEVSYQFVGDVPNSEKVPDSEKVAPGTSYDADKNTGSITDYTFEGWFTDKDCTTKYVDGTEINANTILYGKWTHNPEVSYQFVGDVPNSEKVPDSERVVPGTPYDADKNTGSNDDYIFDGWYTDPGCTTKYTDGTKINGDTTLYGKWTKKVEVSYEFKGDVPYGKEPPASEKLVPGTQYDPSSVEVPVTHTFDGWYLDPDCTVPFGPGTPINSDTVLYGVWTKKDGAVENVPGAGPSPKATDVIYPEGKVYDAGDIVPVPDDPIYSGDEFKFDGWFADPDCTIPYTPTAMTDSGFKIYAKWTQNPLVSYTFLGKVPDGFSVPKSQYLAPGTAYTSVDPQGTTTSYVFDGWYLDPACTQKYVDGTVINSSITLYGKWLPVLPKTGEEVSALYPIGGILVAGAIALMVVSYKKRKEDN